MTTATAITIVGSYLLLFLIFWDIKNSNVFYQLIRYAGFWLSSLVALAGLNYGLLSDSGTPTQLDNAGQLVYMAYIPFVILFLGIFLIMLVLALIAYLNPEKAKNMSEKDFEL